MAATTRIEVDGEVFTVGSGRPGQYFYTWVSGRDPEYGFTLATSDGSPLTVAAHEEAVRDFLAEIDPATGYLPD